MTLLARSDNLVPTLRVGMPSSIKAGYAELRADPQARAEYLVERKQWDGTLMDGLDPDERWTEDDRCLSPEAVSPTR